MRYKQITELTPEQQALTELRRVLIEGIGYARICQELQATQLDLGKNTHLLKWIWM